MAVDFKIDKEHMSRGSLYRIDPRRVKVNPELNGRHDLPPIEDLLQGFQDIGQLQPCPVGNDGGDAVLRMGHRRWRAAMKLTETSPLPDLGYWPLLCVYYRGNEWDAYLAAIAENHQRESTTPIDDAKNCARMEKHGMNIEHIAGVFYPAAKSDPEKMKTASAWVKQRLALVTLAPEGEDAVKNGRLKPTAAVAIAKLSQKAQKELFAEQKDAKRITASVLKPVSAKKVTITTLKKFWEPLAADRKGSALSRLAEAELKFLESGDHEAFYRNVLSFLKTSVAA